MSAYWWEESEFETVPIVDELNAQLGELHSPWEAKRLGAWLDITDANVKGWFDYIRGQPGTLEKAIIEGYQEANRTEDQPAYISTTQKKEYKEKLAEGKYEEVPQNYIDHLIETDYGEIGRAHV